jgi:SAM-dependent methyltransferase
MRRPTLRENLPLDIINNTAGQEEKPMTGFNLCRGKISSYPDNINPAAYSIIAEHVLPLHARKEIRFLELGCSTGALGGALINEHPSCHWIGVDYNAAALEIAKHRLSSACWLDLNNINKDKLSEITKAPDFIVMIDVLEHVYEPYSFLKAIRSAFPNASIICVLPNIACYQTYDKLSAGNFSYDESGIFDKTHRTFYTARSACQFFVEFGYQAQAGPIFLPDPVMHELLQSNPTYPLSFTRGNYSINIADEEQLISLCSYGFGFLFRPRS